MGRGRSRLEWDEDEDGEPDVFSLSSWELARRAERAIEDDDALTLKECLEAGARAEGLLALAAGAGERSGCLEEVVKRLEEQGRPGCSKEALERASDANAPGHRVGLMLEANARAKAPLSLEELGAAERLREAMEQGSHGELFAWLRAHPGLAVSSVAPGVSALAFAVDQGWSRCVEELLLAGAPADERGEGGEGLLMRALEAGFLRVADELERAGARGPLSKAGGERGLMERLREAGREDWGAKVEREWLDRQARPGARGMGPGRL